MSEKRMCEVKFDTYYHETFDDNCDISLSFADFST